MLWEQAYEPQANVSTAFSSSLKLHECFYNSIETRRIFFLFPLGNNVAKREKRLVNLLKMTLDAIKFSCKGGTVIPNVEDEKN